MSATQPSPQGTPLVELTGVVAGYGDRDALRGVDLVGRAGELCAVLGPNGAGKSTLVRVAVGALAPRAGSVALGGRDLGALDRGAIAKAAAVVHQEVDVALGFAVAAVVMMGRAPHQGAWMRATDADRAAVERALEACDLASVRDRPVETLSGGERRRVAIARALAQQARVLVLDEPTAHLDVRHALDVLSVVRAEVEERSVAAIVVLHDPNLALAFADRLVLLRDGRVAAEGPPGEVARPDVLEMVFDAPFVVAEHPALDAPFVAPRTARRRGRAG